MADTGNRAGQQVEFAFRLTQDGAALSYANAAAFEAAGWAVDLRVAQADQTFSYTIQPHTDTALANEGYHLLVTTMVNGLGNLIVSKPTTGTGWHVGPDGYALAFETNDIDSVYSLIVSTEGIVISGTNIVQVDFDLVEGQSWTKTVTASETALTEWGYDSEDLADGTLTLRGEVRLPTNAQGIPNAHIAVSTDTATPGTDPVIRLSFPEWPVAVTGVQEGMTVVSADSDNSTVLFQWDVEAQGTYTVGTPSAVGTGAGGTFTFSTDERRRIAIGTTFTISGSTGNDGDWTAADVVWNGSTTVVTVLSTQTIPSAVADGSATTSVEIPLLRGTMTARRNETTSS